MDLKDLLSAIEVVKVGGAFLEKMFGNICVVDSDVNWEDTAAQLYDIMHNEIIRQTTDKRDIKA